MKHSFNILQTTRKRWQELLNDCNVADANHIPKLFNNNIIWNAGHVLATQQLLCYGLSGLPFTIDEKLVNTYRKGTRPSESVDRKFLVTIKELMLSTAEQLEHDYENGIFQKFSDYRTSYGFELHNIEEAISFNNTHEAMHLGFAKAIKKLQQ